MENYIELFGNMLECGRVPAMITNSKNIIVHINRSMAAHFGRVTGHHRSYLFANNSGYDYGREDPFESIFAGMPEDEMHAEVVIADVTYDVICQRVACGPDPSITVMVFEDITEKKNLETAIAENLRTLQRETSIAQSIQKSILPINDKHWNTVEINAIYLPSGDLGGDVYDLIQMNENEYLFYIADVSGHSIQASLLTIYLRENIRANAAKNAHEDITALMRSLLTNYKALDIDAMMYIGLLLCKYDKEKNELSVLNAGHNCYPLIIRGTGRVEEIPICGMPLSSVSDENSYEAETVGLYSGDRVVLFTDGLAEEQGIGMQEPFGSLGVRRVVEENYRLSGNELAKKVAEKSTELSIGKAKDDRTVVVIDIL
jgi:sigma-B regulation protein RsbU (phosphoserine phosphatase)